MIATLKISSAGSTRKIAKATRLAKVNGWSLVISTGYNQSTINLIFTGETVTDAWINGYVNN